MMDKPGRYDNAFQINADLFRKQGFVASLDESSSSPFLSYPSGHGSESDRFSLNGDLSGTPIDGASFAWSSPSESLKMKDRPSLTVQCETVYDGLPRILETGGRMAKECGVNILVKAKEFRDADSGSRLGYKDGYRGGAGGLKANPGDELDFETMWQLLFPRRPTYGSS